MLGWGFIVVITDWQPQFIRQSILSPYGDTQSVEAVILEEFLNVATVIPEQCDRPACAPFAMAPVLWSPHLLFPVQIGF